MGARVLAGRYELLAKIGEGGMAVVFKAKDRMLDRFVALKILRPEYTQDKNFIASFLRESQLVAGIVDPNIVQVYDVGQEGNIHYIVMELVDGEPLSNIIRREGRLDAHRVVSYGKQIAKALATAHENDLIHRDIKPHNIMITKDGVAKLTDFGIAKRMVPGDNLNSDEKEAVMGSIHYFSPEQARGSNVDERSDIYSLGIVMYEMITGQVPYDGDDAVEVAVKHMNSQMVPPSQIAYDMPQDLEDIIIKATSKNPADRYDSAEDMIYALNFVKYSRLVDYQSDEEVDLYQTGAPKKAQKTNTEVDDDDDDEDDEPRRRHIGLIFTAIILIGSLALGLVSLVFDFNGGNKTVPVPNLKGKSYELAQAELEKLGLNIAVDMQIVSTTQAPGTIVSQNVTPGTEVKQGHTIKVNIAKNNENSVVPNVIGKTIDEAQNMLINEGFTIGEITSEYSNFDWGIVLSVNPDVGTSKKTGSAVNIVISLGKNPEEDKGVCIDVRGLTEEDAKKKISAAGCTVSVQYIAGTGGDDDGTVVRQFPAYNEPVEAGTQFTITVKSKSATSITFSPDWSNVKNNKTEYTIEVYFTNSTDPNKNDGLTLLKTIKVKYKESITVEFTESGYAKVSIDSKQVQNFKIDKAAGTATIVK